MAKTGGTSVGNLTAFLGLDDGDFTRGIGRAQSALTRMNSTMQSVGSAMTTFVTLPLLAMGGGAVKMAMDFEKAFSDIEGLVGVARDQVAQFRQEIMAMSPETSRPPQELAEALRFVTSSGFEGAQALDIVRQSAKAAAAGLGETQGISDLVTAAINAYGKENLNASEAVDTLTAAVREGKAEGSDMANALGFVMPIASEMGVEFHEVAGAVAAMTRSMKSGSGGASTAATNLRQLLSDILDPSARAKVALQEMGTSASELRRAIREEGLLSVLGFLKRQMIDNEEAMSNIFPNVRALTGALQLVGANGDEVAQVFANVRDSTGDMDNAFGIAAQNSTFKFNQGLAELKVAGIELGVALMPIFLDIVKGIRDLAHWFSSLDEAGKRWAIIVASMAAAAGPLVLVVGSMVTIFGALTLEIVAVVAAIAALGAGIIYLYENWEAIKERITDWTWWKNLLLDMTIFMLEYNPFIILLQKALKIYNALVKGTAKMFNDLTDMYNGFLLAIGGPNSMLIKWVSPEDLKIEDPWEKAIVALDSLKDKTKEYKNEFKSFSESMVSFAGKVQKAISDMFPKTGSAGLKGMESPTKTDAPITTSPFTPEDFGDWESIDIRKPEASMKKMIQLAEQLEHALQSAIANGIEAFAESLGEMFATGDYSAETFFNSLMNIVADFLGSFGKALISAGVAAIAFENLLANPYAAVAAGVALIVAAGAVKSILSKGPMGNKGSASTSNGVGMSTNTNPRERGSSIQVEVQGRIRGYDLDIIGQKNAYRRNRLG
jgi:TP901 family phage tail tape measure protein